MKELILTRNFLYIAGAELDSTIDKVHKVWMEFERKLAYS